MNESQVFANVLKRATPAERATYLDEACAGNAQLRADLEALLQAHANDPDFLEQPAASLGGTVDEPGAAKSPSASPTAPGGAEQPGTVLARRYKLLEMIGEGGMGSVWMAQQTEPVKRLVAVKLIKAGMDSRQVLARFEAERQALALMDHPNIAKVLDAGAAADGRPFFVMELVKGMPITQFCDEHHLTPRQRLELFVPVCQAIQHAHQKGIIHRDVKPPNVLVALYDDRPVPKVIDFGVAKATGQQLTEQTLHTGFGAVVGTVEYMSPEQASFNQLDVDTRSDVYALGVLLYELLAGSPPFSHKELEKVGVMEMLRVIREQEPSKPSTKLSTADGLPSLAANRGTEPAKLTKLLRGELDWIVMKALEKDRRRRYETANGFAMDLQRYLADEPVLACPLSAWYRFRKFARRNKQGLVFAGLSVAFVVLLGAAVGWAFRDRAAREEVMEQEQAARLAATADKVNQALKDAAALQAQGKWAEALEAVKRADGFLAGGGSADLAARIEERRKDLEMILRLDEIRFPQAVGGAEGPVDPRGADAAYAAAFRDYGIDVEALEPEEAAARVRERPILVELTVALDNWARRRKEASKPEDTNWQRLVAVARAADPDDWRNQMRDALVARDREALNKLAVSEKVKDLPLQTLSLLIEALDVQAGGMVLRLARQKHPDDFWINFQSAWMFDFGSPQDLTEAIRYYSVAVAIRPRNLPTRRFLASALLHHGKLDEAVAVYQQANEFDPKSAWASTHLVATLINLANARRAQNRLDETIAYYRKAVELDSKNVSIHNNLGNALKDQGKLDEAVGVYRKAIELDPKLAVAHCNLGLALYDQKKLDEAIACYKKAIELDPKYADAHNNLGIVLKNQGKLDEGIACFKKAIELDPKYALAHTNLGAALADQKKLGEAIACYQKAIELDPRLAVAHYNLGNALIAQGKVDAAIACYNKAIALDPRYAPAHFNLGSALKGQGKVDATIACYQKAIALDPKNAWFHIHLGDVLREQRQLDEAIISYRKAIELDPKYSEAHNNLGIAMYDQKKLEQAIACFKKAIELDPKNAYAHNNLGKVLKDQGKLDEAVASLRKAIELDPHIFAPAHFNLGDALQFQGRLEEAIACYKKAIEIEPKFALAHNSLGGALAAQGKVQEAIACYKKAIEIEPKFALAHNNLAWLYATGPDPKLRNPGEAIRLARRAVELTPQEGTVWNTLGAARYRAGEWKPAIVALEKSMALRKGGNSNDWFFLAQAHWQLGEKEEARKWYEQAVGWMEKNQPNDSELRRFRAEAAELLGVKEKK